MSVEELVQENIALKKALIATARKLKVITFAVENLTLMLKYPGRIIIEDAEYKEVS